MGLLVGLLDSCGFDVDLFAFNLGFFYLGSMLVLCGSYVVFYVGVSFRFYVGPILHLFWVLFGFKLGFVWVRGWCFCC